MKSWGMITLILMASGSNASSAVTFSSVPDCAPVSVLDWGSKISAHGKCLLSKVTGAYPWEPTAAGKIDPYMSGDLMQSYFDLYRVSTHTFWLDELIEAGSQVLSHRDSVLRRTHYLNEYAPAWQNLDYKLIEPSFTGHIFTPMMAFAAHVLTKAPPALQVQRYTDSNGKDKSYLEWANEFANAFAAAFHFHRSHGHLVALYEGGVITQAYFKYPDLINAAVSPAAKSLSGTVLPVNMNADMFTALIYMHEIQQVRAPAGDYNRMYYKLLVSGYINYLFKRQVLRFKATPSGAESLVWSYSEHNPRMEDVGHANVVVRFLNQVYNRAWVPALAARHILALEKTLSHLVLNHAVVLKKDPAGVVVGYTVNEKGEQVPAYNYRNTLMDGSVTGLMGKLYHTSFYFAYGIRSSAFPKQALADIQSARSAASPLGGLRSLGPLSLGVRGMHLQP